jgi:hypothetical protein
MIMLQGKRGRMHLPAPVMLTVHDERASCVWDERAACGMSGLRVGGGTDGAPPGAAVSQPVPRHHGPRPGTERQHHMRMIATTHTPGGIHCHNHDVTAGILPGNQGPVILLGISNT